MKGLIYGSFLINKVYFIGAGITAAVGTIGGVALWLSLGSDPETAFVADMVCKIMPIVVMVICEEMLARDLEKNVKSRFADYTLSAMTTGGFVLTELVKNLLTMGFGFVAAALMQLAFSAAEGSAQNLSYIGTLFIFALVIGAIDWAGLPLTITLKSAEKAGMVVGLIVGFGMAVPIISALKLYYQTVELPIMQVIYEPWFKFAAAGAAVAVYALFYAVLSARVKRGDVC